jgi:hypothetical protein
MQLFSSTGLEPNFQYQGDFLGQYKCKNKPFDMVFLSVSDTANRDIKLVHIYINGVRRHGTRYKKTKLGIFEIDILLNRIYWDYLCQTIK